MATLLDYYHPFDGTASNEDDWRKIMLQVIGSGVLRNEDNKLVVSADGVSGRVTKVATGKAWMRGTYGENTSIKTMTHAANASGNPRIDLVIVRVDFTNNRIELDILQGTPAGSPAAPALTQTAAVWEESLAQVAIANGYTNIAAVDVTDTRPQATVRHGAGGVLASATSTADVAAASTATGDTDWTGYSVTFVAKANRRYRVMFAGLFESNGSPNLTGMRAKFMEGATQLLSAQMVLNEAQLLQTILDGVAAGPHTYKMTLRTATGVAASSIDILGSASASTRVTTPIFLVEDVGPAL